MFDVQKGVPMPDVRRSAKRWKYPVDTMEVGDMFVIPGRTVRSVSAYISRITKDMPKKFNCRHVLCKQVDDTWVLIEKSEPGSTEGVGVWRTE